MIRRRACQKRTTAGADPAISANSYYQLPSSIYLGLPGSVAVSAEGLKGKRVGVQDHTQQEDLIPESLGQRG